MEEIEEMVKAIIKILRNKRGIDEYSKSVMCRNLLDLLLKLYDCGKTTKSKEKCQKDACRYAITDLIPLTEQRLKVANTEFQSEYYGIWQQSYALAARRSLEHFLDYMEWDMEKKVFGERKGILKPFAYFLNKSAFDVNLQYVVGSYFPSAGKSYVLNNFSAWLYGLSCTNSILRISYSEELVLGFSRAVQSIIKNPRFSEIFPDFKKYGDKPFAKEKESDWILKGKGADIQPSHISRTREGSVTGVRANKAIIFDDLTKGADEATNTSVHQKIYNSWKTEWYNRRTSSQTKYIFVGTMWSPEDILNRVTNDIEQFVEVVPSKQFKYVWEAVDGSAVFIRVPLLDENNNSTCPDVMSTKEAVKLRDTTDPFLWACVYQQEPIAPSGLEFAWENLETYETIPTDAENYCMAVLDPSRKGKDSICMPICKPCADKHYVVDCLFKAKAIREVYDDIVWKIISNKVRKLVIEENTDESLRTVIEEKLKKENYTCEIIDKYNTIKKEDRIKNMRYDVITRMVFRDKKCVQQNSEYGKMMRNFTTYSFDYPNKHDDAPDGMCMYASEIILGKSKPSVPKGINRRLLGI